ncbi:nucleotide kinase domain-containing protein [Parabacteroides goldsteinii]|uniref:nucleotide kinase domain-containing protein n=1 Tax=Parabacteroides goldsteinii TaxID=328812 RepID=UPI001E5E731B|nr:nucleotide kinase domain-containing protein [Parabacteroides goldsteinii]
MMVNRKHKVPIPNKRIFFYYFYFMQERMKMFWKKCELEENELTKDPILKTYKFTNVYRACDRVSQYLISHVIYKDIELYTPQDVLLRILIFKIFNKIETWEYLKEEYGDITCSNFDISNISHFLSLRQAKSPIFSNAYMMAGSHQRYDYLKSKHEKWLQMVKSEFLDRNVVDKVLESGSMEKVFFLMQECSFIGCFLAYQYTIDFNYSPYVNFDENSFVKAGIGAVRGIKKCFTSIDNYEDAIRYTYDHLDDFRKEFGLDDFKPLPGRDPHLIDIQNCFCETDKYLRAKMPELLVGNVRIKQHYRETPMPIDYEFPPKWNITEKFHSKCTQKHIRELTLF